VNAIAQSLEAFIYGNNLHAVGCMLEEYCIKDKD